MLDEIYVWMESYAGVSFEFEETIAAVSGTTAIVDPYGWYSALTVTLCQLDDACDIIDMYQSAIPDNLPTRKKMKRVITENVLGLMVENIRNVCSQLNIEPVEIKTTDILKEIIETMYELLNMLNTYSIDEIIKNNLYVTHEEENDDSFANMLNIMKEDMVQLVTNAKAIRDQYYESLDTAEELGEID